MVATKTDDLSIVLPPVMKAEVIFVRNNVRLRNEEISVDREIMQKTANRRECQEKQRCWNISNEQVGNKTINARYKSGALRNNLLSLSC